MTAQTCRIVVVARGDRRGVTVARLGEPYDRRREISTSGEMPNAFAILARLSPGEADSPRGPVGEARDEP